MIIFLNREFKQKLLTAIINFVSVSFVIVPCNIILSCVYSLFLVLVMHLCTVTDCWLLYLFNTAYTGNTVWTLEYAIGLIVGAHEKSMLLPLLLLLLPDCQLFDLM